MKRKPFKLYRWCHGDIGWFETADEVVAFVKAHPNHMYQVYAHAASWDEVYELAGKWPRTA